MRDILQDCSDLTQQSFAPGEVLLTEGEPGGRLFVLVSGRVAVMKGKTEITRIEAPGALFGEISALMNCPYSATVVALNEVKAYRSDDAAAFIASRPAIALHTATILAQRLHEATAYLADLKEQFQDRKDHFGMMDQILDALMQRQEPRGAGEPPVSRPRDPRL